MAHRHPIHIAYALDMPVVQARDEGSCATKSLGRPRRSSPIPGNFCDLICVQDLTWSFKSPSALCLLLHEPLLLPDICVTKCAKSALCYVLQQAGRTSEVFGEARIAAVDK
jgi:hypothetical protein